MGIEEEERNIGGKNKKKKWRKKKKVEEVTEEGGKTEKKMCRKKCSFSFSRFSFFLIFFLFSLPINACDQNSSLWESCPSICPSVPYHSPKTKIAVFRCDRASLTEVVSIHPSILMSVHRMVPCYFQTTKIVILRIARLSMTTNNNNGNNIND